MHQVHNKTSSFSSWYCCGRGQKVVRGGAVAANVSKMQILIDPAKEKEFVKAWWSSELFSKGHEEYDQKLLVLCLGKNRKSQSLGKEAGSVCEMGECVWQGPRPQRNTWFWGIRAVFRKPLGLLPYACNMTFIFPVKEVKWKSLSRVRLFATPIYSIVHTIYGLYSKWNSPGQNTGVSSLFFLQAIFPTQGSNQVSCIAGRFFTSRTTKEAQEYWSG